MKIGLVGYQGSGKSTLFHWITGVAPDPALTHTGQSAMAPIPDARFEPLCKIYHPKKVTHAAIELVDTPGLSRTHEGNAARMAMIREAGCLVFVVAAFDGADPAADLRSFDEDLVLADMEIVTNRIERVEDQLKKPLPRPEHQQLEHEHGTLKIVLAAMEVGQAAPRVAHDRRAAEGHPRVPAAEREAPAGDRQHGRRRIAAGAIHGPFHAGAAGAGRSRRPGVGTVEDEPRGSGGVRRRDGHHHAPTATI